MTLALGLAQQDIRTRLATFFVQQAIEGGVPAAEELQRVDGDIVPYILYNFADLAPTSERSFIGPRGDNYTQPVNIYALGPDIASARALGLKVLDVFLGFVPSHGGPMRKRPGGGAFAVRSTNGADEAYIVATSFVFTVEVESIPSDPVA